MRALAARFVPLEAAAKAYKEHGPADAVLTKLTAWEAIGAFEDVRDLYEVIGKKERDHEDCMELVNLEGKASEIARKLEALAAYEEAGEREALEKAAAAVDELGDLRGDLLGLAEWAGQLVEDLGLDATIDDREQANRARAFAAWIRGNL